MLRLGWFSTGRGEGSRGLFSTAMEAIARRELDASVLFVFCNRDPGEHEGSDQFMSLVRQWGIPLVTLSSRRFRKEQRAASFDHVRAEFDREVMRRIAPYQPDLCVLAGYMLVVGQEMCNRYVMLNLHPALPGGPAGTWQEVIWQLIASRAPEAGAMVHVATEALDQGPPVSYFGVPLQGSAFTPLWEQVQGVSVEEIRRQYGEELPLFKAIRLEGMRRERPLLLETLKGLATGRIRIVGHRAVDASGKPIAPICLDHEVEQAVAKAR